MVIGLTIMSFREVGMLRVECERDGEVYVLPLPESVGLGLWEYKMTKTQRRDYLVYSAIAKRENYYQYNDPTAFGNPDYERLDGTVYGLMLGFDLDISTVDGYIIVRKGSKTIMMIQKPDKPDWYYDKKKDAIETWNKVFG